MKRKNETAEQPPSILDLPGDVKTPPVSETAENPGALPKVAVDSLESAKPVFGFKRKTMWGF